MAKPFFARIAKGHFGAPITTDYVLDEELIFPRRRWSMSPARRPVDLLCQGPTVSPVCFSGANFETSLSLMRSQGGMHWSFSECASFVTMEALGLSSGFGVDSDFRQAGFELLFSAVG